MERGINVDTATESRAIEYRVFPRRIADGGQGRVFRPPIVPRSISLVNDVVNARMLVKKRITQSVAEIASELTVVAPPQAKLLTMTELAEKVRIDMIS